MTTLLGDSLTVGIVLALIFGAVCFYLYSRMSQNEKRVGLLENLLLSLKMSTEASLFGPDMVEPTSSPAPLSSTDVEEVTEETYADMLKGMASAPATTPAPPAPAASAVEESISDEKAAEELLRSLDTRKMDANYESMSLKELQALAKQRGLAGSGQLRKRELIDALKRQGEGAPSSPQPLPTVNEFAGAVAGEVGFDVELTNA
jgi:type IV secretory pathway VirB10-like protein